jgi:hypothetical protein
MATKSKPKAEVKAEARLESQLRAKSGELKDTDRKYKALQDDLNRTEDALANALKVMAYKPNIYKIAPEPVDHGGQATAFLLLSDVHCDEIIPKHKVNGLNHHTPEISQKRVAKVFDRFLRFVRVDRNETTINNVVVWLGGDFFTGEMHEASIAFAPIIATMFAQDMIISGLKFLLGNESNLTIHVVVSCGNHGRQYGSMKPVNQSSEQEHSLEWMMYHAIRAYFEKESRITFQMDNSYQSYLKVYNKVIRFNHGHLGWRYNDGMGGVHGPLWKIISQKWNHQVKADLTICGHYHSLTFAALSRPYIVNGSTVGMSPYSMSFSTGAEPPAQAYFLVHSKYGIVGQRPLFAEN